jgi:hypothetical protein
MTRVIVSCKRDGKYIAAYSFAVGGAAKKPNDEHFIAGAKMNLTDEGKASPPYVGITFEVRRDERSQPG